jgi:peptidyl-prolyl cis-trans isomerase B (cyclophilin B)
VPVPAPKGVQHLKAPTLKLAPSRTYTVKVVTNCGTFAFALNVKQDPKTAASVYALVKRGFYDGLIFHRVVPGFVIQGGDPLGNGSGGPGYTVVEAPPRNTQYVRGVVAMAKTQTQPAGASGSQFFVVTGSNVGLPPDYAVAGKVVSGQGVVDAIGMLSTDASQMPMPAVVMSRVTVSAR